MPDNLIGALVAGGIGTAFLAAYLRDAAHVLLLWGRGIRTTAVVVDHAVNEVESGTQWTPIFAFEDQHGNRVSAKPIVRMDAKMDLGREVPVIYMAHRPQTMLLFTRWNMVRSLLENSFILILGSLFLAFGVAFAIA